jgi:hypothetical protein
MKQSSKGLSSLLYISIIFAGFVTVKGDWFNSTMRNQVIPNNSYLEMRDYILNNQPIQSNYGQIRGIVELIPLNV